MIARLVLFALIRYLMVIIAQFVLYEIINSEYQSQSRILVQNKLPYIESDDVFRTEGGESYGKQVKEPC